MFGLDTWIANFSDGATLALVVVVAVVLGLRHATDPDHLAAVTTLIATGRDRAARTAARLGLAWGLGHATSLFAFGLPIVLFKSYLPEPVQAAAETSVGVMIALLALWLLVRWRRGLFHLHHDHGGAHAHGARRRFRTRSPLQALGSDSCTEWAAAPASASCCWRRSTTAASPSSRSACLPSARPSRWPRSRPAGE